MNSAMEQLGPNNFEHLRRWGRKDSYRNGQNQKRFQNAGKRCYRCGEVGHLKNSCGYNLHKELERLHSEKEFYQTQLQFYIGLVTSLHEDKIILEEALKINRSELTEIVRETQNVQKEILKGISENKLTATLSDIEQTNKENTGPNEQESRGLIKEARELIQETQNGQKEMLKELTEMKSAIMACTDKTAKVEGDSNGQGSLGLIQEAQETQKQMAIDIKETVLWIGDVQDQILKEVSEIKEIVEEQIKAEIADTTKRKSNSTSATCSNENLSEEPGTDSGWADRNPAGQRSNENNLELPRANTPEQIQSKLQTINSAEEYIKAEVKITETTEKRGRPNQTNSEGLICPNNSEKEENPVMVETTKSRNKNRCVGLGTIGLPGFRNHSQVQIQTVAKPEFPCFSTFQSNTTGAQKSELENIRANEHFPKNLNNDKICLICDEEHRDGGVCYYYGYY